jgi:uncharacterized membrane protein
MALGWGLFNLVEGIINHHILHRHHVREVPEHLPWDVAFLATGLLLVAVGLILIRLANAQLTSAPTAMLHTAR